MRYSLSISSILLFSLLCFLFETFFTSVSAGDIIRIPEHLHDHDEEHGEYLTIETVFKPDNCDEEHTRKSKLADHLLVRFIGYIDESSQAGRKGQMIDKSGKMPFVFRLGFDQVIRGWDEGLKDMCIGEKRRLIVPPSFGYGNQGTKSGLRGVFIEPGSTLRFEVELVGFQDKRQKQNLFMEMDTDNDGQITYKEMEWWFANKHPAKLSSIPPGTWERDDKNMDGMISWNEFSGPKGISPDAIEITGEL